MKGEYDEAIAVVDKWNRLFPEAPMPLDAVATRTERRLEDEGKLLNRRAYDRLPKGLKLKFRGLVE